jgi:hypothetical protein
MKAGEGVDLTPYLQVNDDYFKTGPGYSTAG